MRRFLFFLAMGAALACLIQAPVWGQVPGKPQALRSTPGWRPIPAVPGVEYAPYVTQDIFRYRRAYYYFSNGRWFNGKSQAGPWEEIVRPPQVFYQVEAQYFKYPPGWARGRKTGWRGEPLPPGQMKKLYRSGPPGHQKKKKNKPLPPGQMKKLY